jgi:hypothetical protein
MAGYLIAVAAFALPLAFAATGLGRPRIVLGVGAVLAAGWVVSLAATRAEDARGEAVIPLWLLGGLVVLLYAIWCGGLWLGLRLRRLRTR